MNIFDLLAEWNITKWLKEPKNNETVEGRTEESAGDGKTNFGKAYESHLLDDIKLHFSQKKTGVFRGFFWLTKVAIGCLYCQPKKNP